MSTSTSLSTLASKSGRIGAGLSTVVTPGFAREAKNMRVDRQVGLVLADDDLRAADQGGIDIARLEKALAPRATMIWFLRRWR